MAGRGLVDAASGSGEVRSVDIEAMVKELRAIEQRYAPASGTRPEQLAAWRTRETDREEVCSTGDATGAWVVVMLCARYGIRPFRRAINQHINDASVLELSGTYRGNAVTHFFNPATGVNVIATPGGQYVSGWRLSAGQLENFLRSAALGGN